MANLHSLDKIQARRFSVRFDLPDQQLKHWTSDKVEDLIEHCLDKWWYIGSLERGKKSERYHCQLYVESRTGSPIRLGSIVRAIRKQTDSETITVSVDVEPARSGPASMVAYVTKEDTHIWGPYSNRDMEEWPVPRDAPKVTRDDLYTLIMQDGITMSQIMENSDLAVAASSCMKWIASLIRQRDGAKWGKDNRNLEVLYVYGASNTGKSTVARQYLASVVGSGEYFVVSDYERDPWSEYACQPGVLLDDLRLPTRQIGLQNFLQLTDRFPVQLSRRYENSWAAYTYMVITSNWSPFQQWESIKSSSSLGNQPKDEDRLAFYRRLTRILHVNEDGTIEDETTRYHSELSGRRQITLSDLRDVLAAQPAQHVDSEVLKALPPGTKIIKTGRAETIQEALESFGL